jgi:hypothetical protein
MNNLGTKYNDSYRNVFPLPLPDKFYDRVYVNLDVHTLNSLFYGQTGFIFFINAVLRDKQSQYDRETGNPAFCYAGCGKQEELMEGQSVEITQTMRDAWAYLKTAIIEPPKSKVSSSLFEKFRSEEYSIKDACKIYKLYDDYFNKPAESYTKEQEAEKAIVEGYFNIQEDVFISLPLIGYGELDGIIHLVFRRSLLKEIPYYTEGDTHLSEKVIKGLLMSYTHWYEEIFLDWELEGENIEKIGSIREFMTKTVFEAGDKFYERVQGSKAQVFKDLSLAKYYIGNLYSYKERLERNKSIPGKIYQQYVTNAVTSILIDSYAHNVSAHALSTLAWWYLRRAGQLKEEEALWEPIFNNLKKDKYIKEDLSWIVGLENQLKDRRDMRIKSGEIEEDRTEQKELLPIRPEDGKAIIEYPGSLSREFAQLLRFLTEKGAFWSGVTRDANIGGKISSLYSVLWYDFIRNPLYLGTIAKTEDIMKIRIRVVLYDPEPEGWRPNETNWHLKNFQPKNSDIFAEVDLKNPRTDLAEKKERSPHEEVLSVFVKKGENFGYLRDKLKDIKLFFPGGVVGRHAFYTMIENEIRNVKHYNREELKVLQEEGLTVAIGVQPCSLHNSQGKEIYRMSVWLDTPTRLYDKEKKQHLLEQKWNTLKGEIFAPDNYAAMLGGTYQDKVCACFLFNSNFSQVQRGDRNRYRDQSKDTGRDRRYFPWVRPACSPLDGPVGVHRDYKISYSNPTKNSEDGEEMAQLPENLPEKGYLKKVFYMWKGERMLEWDVMKKQIPQQDGTLEESWENPSRFSIVHLPEKLKEEERLTAIDELRREKGIVRIAEGVLEGEKPEERFESAYIRWLGDFYQKEVYVMRIEKDSDLVVSLVYDGRNKKRPEFYYCDETKRGVKSPIPIDLNDYLVEAIKNGAANEVSIDLAHGGESKNVVHYRNHGILRNYFFVQEGTWECSEIGKMMELFEVLATKVCVFDNRIYQRLRLDESSDSEAAKASQHFMRNQLRLAVHKETLPTDKDKIEEGIPIWLQSLDKEQRQFVKDCHFVVMHLSFIESILQKEEKEAKSGESDIIALFLGKYLLPYIGQRENLFFVVTTGRGRNQWWSSLNKPEYKENGYTRMTLFRPVESLLSAVENATGIGDDVELKYRIVKIMFGS